MLMYQQVYANVYILMYDDHFVIETNNQEMQGLLNRSYNVITKLIENTIVGKLIIIKQLLKFSLLNLLRTSSGVLMTVFRI
jgi:hypothetical protein